MRISVGVCVYLCVRLCSLGLFPLQITEQEIKIQSEHEK